MEQLITHATHATFYLQENSQWSASQLVTRVPLYVPPVWPSSPVEVLLRRHVTLLSHSLPPTFHTSDGYALIWSVSQCVNITGVFTSVSHIYIYNYIYLFFFSDNVFLNSHLKFFLLYFIVSLFLTCYRVFWTFFWIYLFFLCPFEKICSPSSEVRKIQY